MSNMVVELQCIPAAQAVAEGRQSSSCLRLKTTHCSHSIARLLLWPCCGGRGGRSWSRRRRRRRRRSRRSSRGGTTNKDKDKEEEGRKAGPRRNMLANKRGPPSKSLKIRMIYDCYELQYLRLGSFRGHQRNFIRMVTVYLPLALDLSPLQTAALDPYDLFATTWAVKRLLPLSCQ